MISNKKALSQEMWIVLALVGLLFMVIVFVIWQGGLGDFIRAKGLQAINLPGFGGP